MEKVSFLMYLDYEEQFNLLTNEELGQLVRAIMQYEKTRQEPELEGTLKMAFSFIKTQLDRDREKYNKKCEKNRENAKRGGRPKKNQTENKKPNGFFENQTVAKKPDEDKEEDKEDDEDKEEDLLLKEQRESKLQQKFLECVGSTNLNAISECISYLDDLPYEVIESVLIRTSRIKNPNWAYAKVILDDYVRKRIDSLAKLEIANKKPSDNNKREYKETDFDSLYANKGG